MNDHSTEIPVTVSGMTNHGNKNLSQNPYVQITPAAPGTPNRPANKICDAFNRCGKKVEVATRKAEVIADNFWNHIKTGPSLSDAAMARITHGTKALIEGGHDKVFLQLLGTLPGEKLLHSHACYISTSTGPAIGVLYISNKRVAFCSDHAIWYDSTPGQPPQWMYYKMIVPLEQIRSVAPSSNRLNPSDKYIQIMTRDNREFWFMGFISYDKALHNLYVVLQRSHESRVL